MIRPAFTEPIREFSGDVVSLDPVLLQLVIFSILLGGIFALAALGLTMIFGVMDVINFAHGALIVLGMYAAWFATATLGVPAIIAIPVAVIALFVVGYVMSVATIEPIIEAPPENQFISTLGVSFILIAAIEILFSADPRSLDLSLGSVGAFGARIPVGQLFALLVSIGAVIALWLFLQRTELGWIVRATADNRVAARYIGVDVKRIDYLTVAIAGPMAGLAGASMAIYQPFDPYIGDDLLVKSFVIVILGGLGSFPGALAGGFIVGFIEVFGGYYLPGTMNEVMIYLLFVLILYAKPTGLFGERRREV